MKPIKPVYGMPVPRPVLLCNWEYCGVSAVFIIVFGCLNQHLGNTYFCGPHYRDWVSIHKQFTCSICGEQVAEYDSTFAVKISPAVISELIRENQ